MFGYVTTLRCKYTTMATIKLWLQKRGMLPRTKAEMVRVLLEILENMIRTADPDCGVDTNQEAIEIMGGLDGNRSHTRRILGEELANMSEFDSMVDTVIGGHERE